MIYSEKDAFNGGKRHSILMNEEDAKELYVKEGDPVVLFNQYGSYQGVAQFGEEALNIVKKHRLNEQALKNLS